VRRFTALYHELDNRVASGAKRAALMAYFRSAKPLDAAWALYFLCSGKLRRVANGHELRAWVAQRSGLPSWLVDDSYDHVGDLAEAVTLLFEEPPVSQQLDLPLSEWVQRLLRVAGGEATERQAAVTTGWDALPANERLVFNKLLTGSLRVGVSQRVVQQALAELSGIDIALIAQRMLGGWTPSAEFLNNLLSSEAAAGDRERPYPFFLASALQGDVADLGAVADWLVEWKWDGIRLQLLRRGERVALWSRGEERLDGRFPEIESAAAALPAGTVLDGELLAWKQEGTVSGASSAPMPFAQLQRRINRLKPTARIISDVPVRLQVFDLLEQDGEDLRRLPLWDRRQRLQRLLEELDAPLIGLSSSLTVNDWSGAAALRGCSRAQRAEGLMLKRLDSTYQAGRRRGDWWKWKVEALNCDAVLIYAQSGHGRRSTLYTDYTFGLWDGSTLVPVAKAYSGLNDAEILKLDRWIRANTLVRFGPVRSVKPEQVFELAFEAVNSSARHKSGVAVRFPRILRWRTDKRPEDADALSALQAMAART
jgi:DNA ligase-1